MTEEDQELPGWAAAAQRVPDAPPAQPLAALASGPATPPEPAGAGWALHRATGTYHEVGDRDELEAAYPGAFEFVEESAVDRSRTGWSEDDLPVRQG